MFSLSPAARLLWKSRTGSAMLLKSDPRWWSQWEVESEEDKVKWWSSQEISLPSWSAAVKKILFVQPSSASAQRVFSLLKNGFNRQQDAVLEETVEASVMLDITHKMSKASQRILDNRCFD